MEESVKEERKVVTLSIDDILPNRFQPRIKFDDTAIFELSESIKIHGVFQPIIVRPIGDKYEIIAGERRYKASVLAGKKEIPAIIMNLNDTDTVEVALIENVQRANLTPIEEAISYKKILDMGYINQEQLAQKLGKTQSTIANKLRLLNLDEEVQEALLENKISERHARSLLKIKDYNDQKKLLNKIIKERLTVRKTDEEIDKMLNNDQFINNNENPMFINPSNDNVVNNVPQEVAPVTPVTPIFGDINNEVINPAEISGTAINSTVISSDVNNNNVAIEQTPMMDVQSIENNAFDFNVPKPLAPMDQFLNTNSQPSTPTVETPVEPVVAPVENPIVEAPMSVESDNQNSSSAGRFFNFSLDNEQGPTPATPETQPVASEPLNEVSVNPISAPENIFGIGNAEPSLVQNNQPINVNPIPSSTFNENQFVAPVEPMGFAPNNQGMVQPVVTPEVNNIPFGFDNSNNVQPVEQVIAPVETPIMPVEPSMQSATMDNDIISVPPVAPFIEGAPVQPEPVANNVMTAVGELRTCVEQIRNMGYEVDVDEIDLESMYQLIIKIEK